MPEERITERNKTNKEQERERGGKREREGAREKGGREKEGRKNDGEGRGCMDNSHAT